VEYILQNDLAGKVRVVDKKVVSMANLSKVKFRCHDDLIKAFRKKKISLSMWSPFKPI
jgi:hypothetical protein